MSSPQPPLQLLQNDNIGGFIFECTTPIMQEFLNRGIFGMELDFIHSVGKIRPGLPLFLYDNTTSLMHGIFEATSYGDVNIDPDALPNHEDPQSGSCFPAQVRVRWRAQFPPLRIRKHTDGINSFRHELSFRQVNRLVQAFVNQRNTDADGINWRMEHRPSLI